MRRIVGVALLLAAPSWATEYRSIGPWFVSTDVGTAGPVPVVGQTGPNLGIAARCEQGVPELVVWGVGSRLDLHFGRPVSLRVMVDGARVFDLRGAATERNRAEFEVAAGPAVSALRQGGNALLSFTDTEGRARDQTMSLALADRAFSRFVQACP